MKICMPLQLQQMFEIITVHILRLDASFLVWRKWFQHQIVSHVEFQHDMIDYFSLNSGYLFFNGWSAIHLREDFLTVFKP